MKKKTVIKVPMNGEKSRSKIMKIAVGVLGVQSAAIQLDKGQIEVVGDGVDAVQLTNLLRKKVGHADLVSVAAVPEKKPEEKKPEIILNPAIYWPSYPATPYYYYNNDFYNWREQVKKHNYNTKK